MPKEKLTPIFVRDKQAAELLAISRAHLWKAYISTGRLKYYKLGARITVFKYTEIVELAEELIREQDDR